MRRYTEVLLYLAWNSAVGRSLLKGLGHGLSSWAPQTPATNELARAPPRPPGHKAVGALAGRRAEPHAHPQLCGFLSPALRGGLVAPRNPAWLCSAQRAASACPAREARVTLGGRVAPAAHLCGPCCLRALRLEWLRVTGQPALRTRGTETPTGGHVGTGSPPKLQPVSFQGPKGRHEGDGDSGQWGLQTRSRVHVGCRLRAKARAKWTLATPPGQGLGVTLPSRLTDVGFACPAQGPQRSGGAPGGRSPARRGCTRGAGVQRGPSGRTRTLLGGDLSPKLHPKPRGSAGASFRGCVGGPPQRRHLSTVCTTPPTTRKC